MNALKKIYVLPDFHRSYLVAEIFLHRYDQIQQIVVVATLIIIIIIEMDMIKITIHDDD